MCKVGNKTNSQEYTWWTDDRGSHWVSPVSTQGRGPCGLYLATGCSKDGIQIGLPYLHLVNLEASPAFVPLQMMHKLAPRKSQAFLSCLVYVRSWCCRITTSLERQILKRLAKGNLLFCRRLWWDSAGFVVLTMGTFITLHTLGDDLCPVIRW